MEVTPITEEEYNKLSEEEKAYYTKVGKNYIKSMGKAMAKIENIHDDALKSTKKIFEELYKAGDRVKKDGFMSNTVDNVLHKMCKFGSKAKFHLNTRNEKKIYNNILYYSQDKIAKIVEKAGATVVKAK